MTASAEASSKLIALTFDDGPGTYTAELVEGLNQRGAKATFFIQGQSVKKDPDVLQLMYDSGHQVASHTYDHPYMTSLTSAQIKEQLKKTRDTLNAAIGVEQEYLLRPPYGDINSTVLQAIGTAAIIWSYDTNDWRDPDAKIVYNRLVKEIKDGDIVLLHDTLKSTVDGVLAVVDKLQEMGYELITVNELFRRRGMSISKGKQYFSCRPNGTDKGAVAEPRLSVKIGQGKALAYLSAQPGVKIYYTTDGSQPDANSKVYKEAFPVMVGQTVCAVAAYNLNGDRSATIKKYIDEGPLSAPVISQGEQGVILKNTNTAGEIRYTTDGTSSVTNGKTYRAPIPYFNGTLRYCAVDGESTSGEQIITVSARGNLFWDISTKDWYFNNMDRAVALGLLNGVAQFRMEPETNVTRGMFVTLLYRLAQRKGSLTSGGGVVRFSDVSQGMWYSAAVEWAAKNQVVNGFEDGTFRPDETITREQMCTMMYRYLDSQGVAMANSSGMNYTDVGEISSWARISVAQMTKLGLVNGMGNNIFAPKRTATRAEAATILVRLYDFLQ